MCLSVRRRVGCTTLLTLAAAAATSVPALGQTADSAAAALQMDTRPSLLAQAIAQSEEPQPLPADTQAAAPEQKKPSPWMLAPVFSSNPKLGTALGATAGYLHLFDPESRPSIFAATGQFTSTESMVGGVLARTSFDADHQRLNAAITFGNIKNDYNDYLGTGVPLRNNAELKSFITRYLYRVHGDWFIGAQGIYQNFTIEGDTAFDDAVLDILGIAPYKSGGLGLVGYYDSRDNDFKPTEGSVVSLNNLAYRESLGERRTSTSTGSTFATTSRTETATYSLCVS